MFPRYKKTGNFFQMITLLVLSDLTRRGFCEGILRNQTEVARPGNQPPSSGDNTKGLAMKTKMKISTNDKEGSHHRKTGSSPLCDVIHRVNNDCPLLFPCEHGRCEQHVVRSGVISINTRRQIYCLCDPGWIGYKCHQCCDQECHHNGTCNIDADGTSFCRCNWGFAGPNCEQEEAKLTEELTTKLAPTQDPARWRLYLGLSGTFAVVFALFTLITVLFMWKRRAAILMKISQKFHKKEEECSTPNNATYKYDAFISYRSTSDDEHFVMRVLFPKLEKDMGFSLCLHQRDFVPGETIANNIIDAIQQSRRTILVLSPSYIQSEWTRLEYQVAQHEMLKLRHRIVPIMFKDISHVKDVDKNLKVILNSVTYLVWPGREGTSVPLFWKALRKALPNERVKADDRSKRPALHCPDGTKHRTNSGSTCESRVSCSSDSKTTCGELPLKVTCI